MALTYEPIATTTLGSAAATITFSSIPATYTDLRLVVTSYLVYTSSDQDRVGIQFNSDTSTNYSRTEIRGNGSSAVSARDTSATSIGFGYVPISNTSNYWGIATADIFSYAGSTYKTLLGTGTADRNGAGVVSNTVGLWRSTSAINSINLLNANGFNFIAGTTATLYGIKNA